MAANRTSSVVVRIASILAVLPAIQVTGAESTFQSLFDGATLTGWDGDPRFWRVEEGAIVGQTTPENSPAQNTFLIYRGSEFGDFELTFQYQVKGYNSGVQYRSTDSGDWRVSGYQADFEDRWHPARDGTIDQFSGMFFEENGRMFLGQRGQAVVVGGSVEPEGKPQVQVVGSLGDATALEAVIRRNDWNEYRILANGYEFVHIINDRVMSVAMDLDERHRKRSGIVAFQLHKGPPMKIQIKDVRIRKLHRE